MADESPETPPVETPTPSVQPPPSGTHRSAAAPPAPPVVAEAVAETPKAEPPPAPPQGNEALLAQLAEMRAAIEKANAAAEENKRAFESQRTEARHAERRAFVSRYGGGLAHPDYEQLLPDVDVSKPEGIQELEKWLGERPQILRSAPRAPMPELTEAEKADRRIWGRPQRTAASLLMGGVGEA